MQIVKFGGGLLADKSKHKKVNTSVLNSLCKQIARAKKQVVVVHGAGSFGHTTAKEHQLHLGFKDPSQYSAVIETRDSMQDLNKAVVSSLIRSGIEAVPVVTSSVAVCDNGRIAFFDIKKVKAALKQGRTPVLFGDVVFDKSMGFSILSGDQIVCYLSKALGAEQVIFTLDVDGVYDDDPKKNPDAKLIEHISFKEIDTLLKKAKKVGDVTGGMFGKLNEIKQAGSGAFILGNGKKKDWLYNALMRKRIVGTVVE